MPSGYNKLRRTDLTGGSSRASAVPLQKKRPEIFLQLARPKELGLSRQCRIAYKTLSRLRKKRKLAQVRLLCGGGGGGACGFTFVDPRRENKTSYGGQKVNHRHDGRDNNRSKKPKGLCGAPVRKGNGVNAGDEQICSNSERGKTYAPSSGVVAKLCCLGASSASGGLRRVP